MKKNSKQKNNNNSKLSLVFAIFSLLSLPICILFYPSTGHAPCGNGGIFTHLLILGFPTLTSILSIIFSVKAITKKEKPKFLPIISLILSLPSIITLVLNLISYKPCPQIDDTQIKNDIQTVVNAITDYQSENKGYLPNNIENLKPYLTNEEWNNYNYTIIPDFSQKNTDLVPKPYIGEVNDIRIYLGAECNDKDKTIIRSNNLRSFAILTKLEKSKNYYCIDQ